MTVHNHGNHSTADNDGQPEIAAYRDRRIASVQDMMGLEAGGESAWQDTVLP